MAAKKHDTDNITVNQVRNAINRWRRDQMDVDDEKVPVVRAGMKLIPYGGTEKEAIKVVGELRGGELRFTVDSPALDDPIVASTLNSWTVVATVNNGRNRKRAAKLRSVS